VKEIQHGETCRKCRQVVPEGSRACACGMPTRLASFDERNAWEAKQWRAYVAQAG
jgi:hypothetical protein